MPGIPITARGAEKLKAELQRLRSVDRPIVIQAIKDAREKGDLSENAEYDAARERQGFIEGRIMELEGKVSSLQIIDPAAVDAAGRIVFGATVELEDQVTGEFVKYQIVGDDEADIKAGLISVSSPIARALIGKTEGDIAQVLAPAGQREYAVVSRQLERVYDEAFPAGSDSGRAAHFLPTCAIGLSLPCSWPLLRRPRAPAPVETAPAACRSTARAPLRRPRRSRQTGLHAHRDRRRAPEF